MKDLLKLLIAVLVIEILGRCFTPAEFEWEESDENPNAMAEASP